ncbi:MAG TPA: VOC family protein, partial [Vicinamibacterales bacterium]|nr:VOC family protein [Vicinamibacterales bacterium]
WMTVATHHASDGSTHVEHGDVSCGWILDRTALHCDRRHRSPDGGLRVSIQIWQADESTRALQIDTYTAGRFGHVVQRSATLSPASVTLTATIPWRSGRANTRSQFRAENSGFHYRNETEEAPGRWRLDFDERWQPASRSDQAPPAIRGIDHVPVAVADLQVAIERYQRLGFALKPGRPHPNGVENQHVKFRDGTEIELITAPRGVDRQTRNYRSHIARGQGPAFLSLFAPAEARLLSVLNAARLTYTRESGLVVMSPDGPLGYVFFGRRNKSPTDLPAHFAHRNTAQSVRAVWLAADDLSAEHRLFAALGATFKEETVYVPDPVDATVARFAEGAVVMLPGRHQIVTGHRIVGMTVSVADLKTAREVIGAAGMAGAAAADRVFVAPAQALGYWLEFR